MNFRDSQTGILFGKRWLQYPAMKNPNAANAAIVAEREYTSIFCGSRVQSS